MNEHKLTEADQWFIEKGRVDSLSRSPFTIGDTVVVCDNKHVMLSDFYDGECPTCHSKVMVPFTHANVLYQPPPKSVPEFLEIGQLKNSIDTANAEKIVLTQQIKKIKKWLGWAVILGIVGIIISLVVGYNKYNGIETAYQELQKKYNGMETAYQDSQREYNSMKAVYQDSQREYNGMKATYQDSQREYSSIKTAYQELQKKYNGMETAYQESRNIWEINITSLTVGDTYRNREWISQPGQALTGSAVRFLMPRITYNSLISGQVTFYVKIINPEGEIVRNQSESPSGYTVSSSLYITHGKSQSFNLRGWGTDNGGFYYSGTWTVQVWYQNVCLYSQPIILR